MGALPIGALRIGALPGANAIGNPDALGRIDALGPCADPWGGLGIGEGRPDGTRVPAGVGGDDGRMAAVAEGVGAASPVEAIAEGNSVGNPVGNGDDRTDELADRLVGVA